MRIGARGQITIPKQLRERFGLRPGEEVEFQVVNDALVLRKVGRKLNLEKWKGYCQKSFSELVYRSIDDFIEDVRGSESQYPS